MKENCLDIGIIQAFLDGELSHDETARVSGHIALCDACALMLAEAEDESAIVFPALEREFNTLVPTQRLWNKINDSIQTERDSRPFWHKAWAFLTMSLANPSMVAAASLLLVFGLFTALWINKNGVSIEYRPTVAKQKSRHRRQLRPRRPPADPAVDLSSTTTARQLPSVNVERASYRPETRRVTVADKAPVARQTATMPGEESYVKTISSLNKTVDEQKDGVLRPSERIAYERDMAVVNDTIENE